MVRTNTVSILCCTCGGETCDCDANAGPVFLTYYARPEIDALVDMLGQALDITAEHYGV